jgi:hypothetical protein
LDLLPNDESLAIVLLEVRFSNTGDISLALAVSE